MSTDLYGRLGPMFADGKLLELRSTLELESHINLQRMICENTSELKRGGRGISKLITDRWNALWQDKVVPVAYADAPVLLLNGEKMDVNNSSGNSVPISTSTVLVSVEASTTTLPIQQKESEKQSAASATHSALDDDGGAAEKGKKGRKGGKRQKTTEGEVEEEGR